MDKNDPWHSNGIIKNKEEKTILSFDDSFDPPKDLKKECMFYLSSIYYLFYVLLIYNKMVDYQSSLLHYTLIGL